MGSDVGGNNLRRRRTVWPSTKRDERRPSRLRRSAGAKGGENPGRIGLEPGSPPRGVEIDLRERDRLRAPVAIGVALEEPPEVGFANRADGPGALQEEAHQLHEVAAHDHVRAVELQSKRFAVKRLVVLGDIIGDEAQGGDQPLADDAVAAVETKLERPPVENLLVDCMIDERGLFPRVRRAAELLFEGAAELPDVGARQDDRARRARRAEPAPHAVGEEQQDADEHEVAGRRASQPLQDAGSYQIGDVHALSLDHWVDATAVLERRPRCRRQRSRRRLHETLRRERIDATCGTNSLSPCGREAWIIRIQPATHPRWPE